MPSSSAAIGVPSQRLTVKYLYMKSSLLIMAQIFDIRALTDDFMLYTIFVIVGIFIMHFSRKTTFGETLQIAIYVFIIGAALTVLKILVKKA
jgi:hypothetical protein